MVPQEMANNQTFRGERRACHRVVQGALPGWDGEQPLQVQDNAMQLAWLEDLRVLHVAERNMAKP